MSRKRVVFLLAAYFVVATIYGAFQEPTLAGAMGYGLVTYFASGVLPFAVWGARGFKAANARSLFIPWAVLLPLAMALQEYGRLP
jgi:hypothetical protein